MEWIDSTLCFLETGICPKKLSRMKLLRLGVMLTTLLIGGGQVGSKEDAGKTAELEICCVKSCWPPCGGGV